MVGYAPDLRHPLAPPEVVYVTEEPPRPRPRWYHIALTLYGVIGCALILGRYVLSLFMA